MFCRPRFRSCGKYFAQAASQAEEGEEEPDLLDWQEDEWEIAKQIASSDRFVALPGQVEVDEWSTMEEFALSRPAKIRDSLLDCIQGSGAFRRFKNAVRRAGIEKDWYAFRDEALKLFAIEWCEENGLEWK